MKLRELQQQLSYSESEEFIMKELEGLTPVQQRNQLALMTYLKEFERYDMENEKIIKKLVYTYGTQIAQLVQDMNGYALGEIKPTPQQLKEMAHYFTASERPTLPKIISEPLPNYWPKILRTHFKNRRYASSQYKMITIKDFEVLQYLRKVEYKVLPPHGNVQYNFYFAPNEYFGNTILNALLIYPASRIYREQTLMRVEAAPILWRKGVNLLEMTYTQNVENPETKQMQVVTRTKRLNSFFHFFTDFSEDAPAQDEDGDLNETMKMHYQEISDELEFAVFPYQLRLYLIGPIEDYELPTPPSSYHSSDEDNIFEVEDEEWEYKNKLKQVMIADDDEPEFD